MLTWWTIRKLRSPKKKVRDSTLQALRAVKGEKLIETLLPFLTDDDGTVRHMAKRAIASCQPPLHESNSAREFVPTLIAAASQGAFGGRYIEPLWALVQIQDPRAADVLSGVSTLNATQVQRALLSMCSVETAPAILRFSDKSNDTKALEQSLTSLGPPVIPALRDALKARHSKVRDLAISVLSKIPEARAEDFAPLLDDNACAIRRKAAEQLHNRGWRPRFEAQAASAEVARGNWAKAAAMGRVAIAPLVRELSCHAHEAVQALGQIGGDQIVPPILLLLPGRLKPVSDQFLFTRIIKALVNGGERGWGILIDLGTRDEWIAAEITPLLLKIGSPAVPSLIQAAEQGNSFAFKMLGLIGDPRALPFLEAALWSNHRWYATDALVAMKHAPTEPRIAAALAVLKEDWATAMSFRDVAIDDMIACHSEGNNAQGIAALERIGKSASQSPRQPAAEAIRRRSDIDIVPSLIGRLHLSWARGIVASFGPQALDLLLPQFEQRFEQAKYADATVALMGQQAVPFVLSLLSSEKWVLRMHGAIIAGDIGDSRVLPNLIQSLDDEASVRKAAATALRSLHWLPPSPTLLAAWLAAAEQWDELTKCGEAAVPVLTARLKHIQANRWERNSWYLIVPCLKATGSRQAVLPLVEFFRWHRSQLELGSENIAEVCAALGHLGGPDAIPVIIEALEIGKEPALDNTRRAAISAAATLTDLRTLPALIALATHSSVAEHALSAIAQILTARAHSVPIAELQILNRLTAVKVLWDSQVDSDNYQNVHHRKVGSEPVSAAAVRQLARQELLRRQPQNPASA